MSGFEDRPIFEVIRKDDGHVFRVWVDGRIEGFGENVVVVNMAAPLLHTTQWLAKKATDCGCVSHNEISSGLL